MKKFIILILLAASLTSCIDYHAEPRYDSRARITGSFSFEEYSTTYGEFVYYRVYISESRHRDEIIIDNFYGSDLSVYAYVDGVYITIPFQVIDGYEIEGTGDFGNGDLHLNYRVRDRYAGTRSDYCETVGFRR